MYSEYHVAMDTNEFPGAEIILDEILTLPCHPGVGQWELETTLDVIKSFKDYGS